MAQPVIITIGNNKGGVGKSTTVVNLAAGMALSGARVLVVDGDPQANTTSSLVADPRSVDGRNLVAALESEQGSFSAHSLPTRLKNLDIVPNTIRCMEWEVRSYSTIDSVLGFSRLLKNDTELGRYDFVFIDTPPNIGPMLRNSLLISDYVIVPVPVGDQYALDGFSTFLKVLAQAKQQNTGIVLLGVLLTKLDRRAGTHKRNRDNIRAFFQDKGIPVLKSEVRVNIDLDRAHSHRRTIFEFDDTKSGAKDYKAVASEVKRRVRKTQAQAQG